MLRTNRRNNSVNNNMGTPPHWNARGHFMVACWMLGVYFAGGRGCSGCLRDGALMLYTVSVSISPRVPLTCWAWPLLYPSCVAFPSDLSSHPGEGEMPFRRRQDAIEVHWESDGSQFNHLGNGWLAVPHYWHCPRLQSFEVSQSVLQREGARNALPPVAFWRVAL